MKKVFCLLLCLICVSSFFSAGALGNYVDTYIEKDGIDNNGGTPYESTYRRKMDYTSSYARNESVSAGSIHCWIHRSNDMDDPSVYTVDRYYGVWTYNGASQNSYYLSPGQSTYMINYVKEDGYSFAALGFIMHLEQVYYRIAWSPDSI